MHSEVVKYNNAYRISFYGFKSENQKLYLIKRLVPKPH